MFANTWKITEPPLHYMGIDKNSKYLDFCTGLS